MAAKDKNISVVEPVTPAKEFLTPQDKHALDVIKLRTQLALSNAEKAVAQNDSAKLSYDNFVLQLTVKYNLKEKDVIDEMGEILRTKAE